MKEQDMGNDKIWRLCLKMGIPCVLAQVVNLLYNIVDRIYIGHMPEVGDAALGGLGLCAPVLTFIAAFSSFVSGGGAPLSAKALGEGDEAKAKKYLNNGFFLLIVFSVVLGLTAFACAKPLLYAIGAGDSNFGYAYDYLTIYLIGTLFVQLATGLNTFLTAQGKSVTAMVSVIIGAALNIALDPLFIFTLNMGVSGAALATVISQFASACFVVAALMSKKLTVRIDFKLMRPELKIIGAIASLGVASFVMSATESVIGFVLNGRLKYYGDLTPVGGDTYVSVLTVLQSAMMLITTPITGFTQGVTPILSFNFGAKHKARLKKCYFFTLAVCFGWCTLLSARDRHDFCRRPDRARPHATISANIHCRHVDFRRTARLPDDFCRRDRGKNQPVYRRVAQNYTACAPRIPSAHGDGSGRRVLGGVHCRRHRGDHLRHDFLFPFPPHIGKDRRP